MTEYKRPFELPLDLQRQVSNKEKVSLPRYGIPAVYHALLMQHALQNLEEGGTADRIIKEHKIDFSPNNHACQFHSSFDSFRERGLFLPETWTWENKGHYFNPDVLNGTLLMLYPSGERDALLPDKERKLREVSRDLYYSEWRKEDFADKQKLQKGLVFANLLWIGTLRSFQDFGVPTLKDDERKLSASLIDYYGQQVKDMEYLRSEFALSWVVEDYLINERPIK